jgi:hypothetical protein
MSAQTFEAPKIGDGEQIGDGNTAEVLNVGRVNQPVQIGNSTAGAGKIGFYGSTPVVQRAAAIQAASVVSASTWASVASNQAAFFAEVAATLTGLGLWKGAA